MVLTWPIDKVDPSDIPAFRPIYDKYQNLVPDLGGMIRFLCYRFDPKAREGRERDSVMKKEEDSAKMAKWKPPLAELLDEDDAEKDELCAAYAIYSEVVGLFFSILDNDDWEFIESLDIAIHNANMIIREPILGDAEVKGKILLNIQKATMGNKDAMALRRELAAKMADSSPGTDKLIMASTKARRPISPEGFLGNG